ncbi:nuclear pore complex subunit Nup85 [Cladophialophora carrionii]|uniref:Nuclear pore complex protein Nup85 n=1 Tax=Cladophialophora carrionii TaxID=86049 RepID=A0A1C1CM10_9EURO|nr:nuclear pore complex subunit Nup85 [Cladophialophora carrionii]
MNRFTADYSSSVNSTPGKQQPSRGFLSSNPPQLASTTPVAPPPSQIFGSSAFGTGVSKLQFTKPTETSPRSIPGSRLPPKTKNGTPNTARVRQGYVTGKAVENEEDGDQVMEEDAHDGGSNPNSPRRGFHSINQRNNASLMNFSTASTRDARVSAPRKSFRSSTRLSALPHKGDDTVVSNLARDMGARAQQASLTEPDELILETEQILRSLDEQSQYLKDSTKALDIISEYAYDLIKEWQRFVQPDRPSLDSNDIGPQPTAPAFAKANYLASLMLVLRHPPPSTDDTVTPTPQVLLDWLDQYHVSYDQMYKAVASARPNCTSHELFWDAVLSLTLRGKLQQVMQLFADADFKYAASAADDGHDSDGYKGAQLQTVQGVIYRARQLLNSCPAIQFGDWNVAGPDWDVFRSSVEAALENLTDEATAQDDEDSFEAENFGLRKPETRLLGRLGQKSSNTLPWTIFQNLKILYNILLGSAEEISAQSQDWLEATTSLTIWWDGTADSTAVAQWSFDVSRANNPAVQDDDFNPYLGRLRDSFLCVTAPDDKNSFQINGMSPVEVGLGCILQGSSPGALTVLRTLSQCIAASVAEIGSKAGWLEDDTTSRPAGLNEEDLMVLSYGASKAGVSKDDLLVSYAEKLFEKDTLHLPDGSGVEGWEVSISLVTRLDDREIMRTTVSNFLDHLEVTTQDRAEKLTNLCSDLGLQDEARKVSDRFGDYLVNNTEEYGTALLCYARSHAREKIRQLVDVLVSYSLVQSRAYPPGNELDDALRSLVSNPKTALVDIAEVDPEAAEMLQFYLVGYACIRRFFTLRDQDVGAGLSTQPSLNSRPLARKRAAAKALIAAINSAADSIYGGLYDPDRTSAIQVDGLLSLLGEATALLTASSHSGDASHGDNRGHARAKSRIIFTIPQIYDLLSAIEDLSTVSARVFAATEECLAAGLREYAGSRPPSPRAVLKKSMSSGSGSGSGFSYSVLGSEMLARSMTTDASGSAVMVKGHSGGGKAKTQARGMEDAPARGWDWREKFVQHSEHGPGGGDAATAVSGRDILMLLRMSLAEELAWAELEEEGR